MPRKYIGMEEAAQMLGITPDELSDLRTRNEISGYRDGPDWKFKSDDLERMGKTIRERDAAEDDLGEGELSLAEELPMDDLSDSILLSEEELGESGDATSSTIIGGEKGRAGESDLRLADEIISGESDVQLASESALEFAGDEDDLVLGDMGGSDITIGGGDSGISLVGPSDSGLALDEPLELTGSGVESFELGEDDMISLDEGTNLESATQLKADDDFLLMPSEDADDASDSGSQVIALDSEEDTSDALLGGGVPTMASMLEEDLGGAPNALGMAATSPILAPEAAPEVPEYPYSVWNVLALFGCVVFLVLGGMMAYDLMRNMWSWEGEYALNSGLMDAVLSWFEKK